MLFNSIQFLLFFIIVTILYFELPQKYRWFLLLVASCYFYMAFKPVYIFIIGFTIIVDYWAGILIENSKSAHKKFFLIVSLAVNIGILVVFKYWNFLYENITGILTPLSVNNPLPILDILLPVGLSFHTFQAMSYTIEVFKGNQKAERHFGIYSLYVMFYPQMVAGPIERPQNLLPQFYENHKWDIERFKAGLMLMLWGFFKKIVIADRLSIYVNETYGDVIGQSGSNLLMGTFFFTFQIYCDFSGYSDIAIGSAKVMGFDLMINFNKPYFSKSIGEFWSRWHISLSTWFRDYVYIPLGGNRVPFFRLLINILIVFLLSGIWHGAQWHYMVWGALHAFYMISAVSFNKIVPDLKIPKLIMIIATFILVMFGWIFFRAGTTVDALQIIYKILDIKSYTLISSVNMNGVEICFSLFLILLLLLKEAFIPQIITTNHFVFGFKSISLCLLIYFFGIFGLQQFIYFQF